MTWLNPWAWIGLLAVGVPIAIHLLTRAQPRPQPFPTLRFLGRATTTAVRRRVLKDRALLAVRVAIVAAIAAAGAQPVFRRPAGLAAGASALRRAVVIDTSDRFGRISTDGRPAIDVARERAAHLDPPAQTSVSIDVDRLPEGLARATTWLLARGGRREIVVVSTFRRGALAPSDIAGVPSDIGVRLVKIDTAPRTWFVGPGERVGSRVWVPRVTLEPDRTVVAWSASSASARPLGGIRVLAGPAEGAGVAAAVAAAGAIGVPAAPDPEPHPIAVVLPGATDRAQILSAAAAIDQRWMFGTVERLRHDLTLAAASAGTVADRSVAAPTSPFAVIARDRSGSPLLEAGRIPGAVDASDPHLLVVPQLLLVAHSDDSLFVSALLGSIPRTDASALGGLEPVTVTPEELASWQRPTPSTPTPGTTTGQSGEDSDGRWFWIAALALLALEGWVRRTRRAASPSEVPHARVA
ncbi:MAG TPA: BatA domain-containing protein [Vicinamibacterales bacterium]